MNSDKNMTDEMLFNESMALLKQSFISQSHTQRVVSRRVKVLIRSIMVALVSSLLFTLYLSYILSKQVGTLSNQLDKISEQGVLLQSSLAGIDSVLLKFEAHMDFLPYIQDSVEKVDINLYEMMPKMQSLSHNMKNISGEVSQMGAHLNSISNSIDELDNVVQSIERDVSDSSKPIRRFNSMNPFNFFN